ncbi:MAG: LPS export ABC transporter permease LptG [Desulfatiglandales bacterium]
MQILTRYIVREFWKIFLITYSVLLVLCVVFDFLEQWNIFLKNDAPLTLAFLFFLYRIPMFVVYVLPVGVLLGTFLTFGFLSKNSEIVAMKTSGISIYRITFPVIVTAFFISVFSFIFAEVVVPYSNKKGFYIQNVKIKKKVQKSFFKDSEIWYRSRDAIYSFDLIEYPRKILPSPIKRHSTDQIVLKGVTISYLDRAFSLIKRIDAKSVSWVDERWLFREGMINTLQPDGTFQTEIFTKRIIPLPETPSDFLVPEINTEEMSFFELWKYAKKLGREGYDTTRYLTDMHAKLSFAFFSLILAILAIPFSLQIGPRGGSIAIGITFSMIIAFIYYLFMALSLALGRTGTLHPFIAAWISNFLFGLVGFFQMVSIKQ